MFHKEKVLSALQAYTCKRFARVVVIESLTKWIWYRKNQSQSRILGKSEWPISAVKIPVRWSHRDRSSLFHQSSSIHHISAYCHMPFMIDWLSIKFLRSHNLSYSISLDPNSYLLQLQIQICIPPAADSIGVQQCSLCHVARALRVGREGGT